jgi:hypothetical protein
VFAKKREELVDEKRHQFLTFLLDGEELSA